ncbi:MAG TPA: hypothetical protein VLA43_03950, partial [Longimicrobiales bacterium]|nr:hypothetical protein [Longimicrobiales bacterium]
MTGRNWEHMDEAGTAVSEAGGRGARWGGAGQGGSPHGVLPSMLVVAAAVLVYLNALGNGFAYDDIVIVRDNPLVHGLGDPLRIWLSPYWPGSEAMLRGLYRPLTSFVFALQWDLGGGAPWVFHGVSVLLHACVALLLYRLLNAVVGWRGATAGAVLFAVHPVHVEAVANVVGQGELLSAVMVLGAAVIHAERPRTGVAPSRQVLVAVLFLGALLAKEHAIVLPVLLLSVDGAQGRWRHSGWGAETARSLILLLAVAAVYLTLRWVVLGGTLSGEASTFLPFLQEPRTRILMALRVWPEYARLLLAPVQLSATYDPGVLPPPQGVTPGVVGGAVLLLAALGAVVTPRAWPAIGWGALWFLAAVLPVSNLVLPIGSVLAERTLYLPSVALALWTGFAVARIGERRRHARWLRTAAAGGLVVALAAMAVRTVV